VDEREGPVKFHITTHAFRKTEQESGALREAEGMGRERMSQPGSGGGGGLKSTTFHTTGRGGQCYLFWEAGSNDSTGDAETEGGIQRERARQRASE